MQSSNNKLLTRDELLSRYFPQYHPVATPVGLSGGSSVIAGEAGRLVLRRPHDPDAPEADFRRQYRALARLPASLAPEPRFYLSGWMAVDYLAGEVSSALPATDELAGLLYHLHRQPLFGWRIALLPLLNHYWQHGDPARRTLFWLRKLKKLRQRREPRPLRLAPLHMDVHSGNLIHTASGLRLIDWEYAGDGDIALELAAVWVADAEQHRRLVNDYARRAGINASQLWHQVSLWQPWVLMLKAGWYEYRWHQSGEQQFITLADDTWRQLKVNG
ncbi:TPA: thiamine kinase [Citrobacter freundii]